LGEVVCIKQGKNISTLKLKDWGYPVFGANGLIGYTDTYHYEEPQVLIACRGSTCGIINWSFPKSFVNNNAMTLLPKSIDKKFLYFSMQLNFISGRIDETITGTGQPQITKETLEPFLIIYPPLPEQSRIATVLSYFDDLIEVKKRQNEILEKSAMAIFKSWFVDFEPFMDGEFVYNEELGRDIPKGWEMKKVIDLCYIISGRGKYLIEASEGIYPLWGANGVLGYIDNYDLEGFSIITGRVGTIGKVFLVEGKYAISDNVLCIIPHQGFCIFFLYLWIKSQIDFESLNVGTSQPLITKTALGNEPILSPPPHILQSFHSLVEPLFQKIILNQKQIMTLRKIRDTLLPLLAFGKLRIAEV
jgi:type I restriction enzyme S subunit